METRQQDNRSGATENIDCGRWVQEVWMMLKMAQISILIVYLCMYDEVMDLLNLKKPSMTQHPRTLKWFHKICQQKLSFYELLPEILESERQKSISKFESTLSSLWNLNLHFMKRISQMYLRLTQGMIGLLLKKLMNRSKAEFLLQSFCTSIRAVIQWHTLEKSIILQANQELTQLSLFASHWRCHLTKNLVLFS